MAASQEQLGGALNGDLKIQYDAATGGYYVLRNGLLVPVPFYETVVTWTAGAKLAITHGLMVPVRFVQFQVQAKVAIGNLAIGQREGCTEFTTTTTTYNCTWRKATTTALEVGVGVAGLTYRSTGELGTAATNAQVDLVVQVFGM